jgi:HemK-like putative methylase
MKISTWLNQQTIISKKELEYLTKHILECNIHQDSEISPMALSCLKTALSARENGRPLAKIINKKPFMEDYFFTNEHTLDPRPETESLIEEIKIKPRTVLELGVGTGALIISVLKKYPKAKGLGIDISKEALAVAARNLQIYEMGRRLKLLENNWTYGISGSYDLILCNPPYVAKDAKLSLETLNDPAMALFGDAKTYEEIFNSIKNIQWQQMIFEVPQNLLTDVTKIAQNFGKTDYKEIFDSQIYSLSIIKS